MGSARFISFLRNLYFKQRDYANAIKKYARVRAFLKPLIPNSDGQDNS